MLDDLVSVIETLQQRIATHRQSLQQNEIRTRTALIDPLLTALGWDVSDPALVIPEYRVNVGWADYALAGSGNQPAAVIEAKRLGSIVENHLDQSVGYCIQQGIAYSGVTDGSHWQLYRTFDPVPMTDKIVLNVNIGNAPAYECALQLLLLWRPNLASGRAAPAMEPLLRDAAVVEPDATAVPQAAPEPTPAVVPAIAPPAEPEWVRLSEYSPPRKTKPPLQMRFANGSTVELGPWNRIPVETAKWLYRQGLLTADNLPVYSGGNKFTANSDPVHSDGTPMHSHALIGNGQMFVNTHVSAKQAREHAKKLLEHCGVDPATVQLQVRA